MKKTFLLVASAIFLLAFNSCEDKDEGNKPVFDGVWEMTYSEDGENMKQTLTLRESTLEMIFSSEIMGTFYEGGGIKGTHTYTDSLMIITVTSIGLTEYNEQTHVLSDIMWYNKGTSKYSDNIDDYGGEFLQIAYEVNGNTLKIMFDDNEDGTYQSDEIEIYTRQ